MEFWIRMLYSALVDADFLDTEEFYDKHDKGLKTNVRSVGNNLSELKTEFDRYMNELSVSYDNTSANRIRAEIREEKYGKRETPVNRIRAEILKACREKTSPRHNRTGGKNLSRSSHGMN